MADTGAVIAIESCCPEKHTPLPAMAGDRIGMSETPMRKPGFASSVWFSSGFPSLLTAAAMLLAGTSTAAAQVFARCEPEGDATIVVTENTTVRNETAILEDERFEDCTVEVADGVVLRLQNVVISTTLDGRVVSGGGDTSSLIIKNSTLNVCDSDVFGFQEVSITHSTFLDPPDTTCDVKQLESTGPRPARCGRRRPGTSRRT